MSEPIGHRRWAIAEGYIPGWSNQTRRLWSSTPDSRQVENTLLSTITYAGIE